MNGELPVKRENEFSYRICYREGFQDFAAELEKDQIQFYRACIVTDSTVGALYADTLAQQLKSCCHKVTVFTFPAGEENKNIETVQEVYEHLIQEGFDRKDMLIALGGGVTGDLTGFVAATYLRGIRFIQVPTTLLSQVDSSIGGKTGVDFRKYKNMVGAFHQPSLVYMNLSTLASLNEEQFSCGMAEIIKAGLIADQSFFHWLSENHEGIQKRNSKLLAEMIYRSCKIKGDVVEEDPTEKGIRAILNFGHTIGHAVEKLKDFSMLHGQCVAAGYVAAAYLSLQRGLISTEDLFEIEKINRMYGLPNRVSALDAKDVLAATKKDKKMSQGSIKFVLLQKMGTAIVDTSLTDDEILCGIQYILGE